MNSDEQRLPNKAKRQVEIHRSPPPGNRQELEIYLLRGWYSLAKLYELEHIKKAVHYELAELEAEPTAKSTKKRRISQ